MTTMPSPASATDATDERLRSPYPDLVAAAQRSKHLLTELVAVVHTDRLRAILRPLQRLLQETNGTASACQVRAAALTIAAEVAALQVDLLNAADQGVHLLDRDVAALLDAAVAARQPIVSASAAASSLAERLDADWLLPAAGSRRLVQSDLPAAGLQP